MAGYEVKKTVDYYTNDTGAHLLEYNINGNGDNGILTIMITPDTSNPPPLGGLSLNNAVITIKEINGKYYYIQLSFTKYNEGHNTIEYLNSLILSQYKDVNISLNTGNNVNTGSSSSSSHYTDYGPTMDLFWSDDGPVEYPSSSSPSHSSSRSSSSSSSRGSGGGSSGGGSISPPDIEN